MKMKDERKIEKVVRKVSFQEIADAEMLEKI